MQEIIKFIKQMDDVHLIVLALLICAVLKERQEQTTKGEKNGITHN